MRNGCFFQRASASLQITATFSLQNEKRTLVAFATYEPLGRLLVAHRPNRYMHDSAGVCRSTLGVAQRGEQRSLRRAFKIKLLKPCFNSLIGLAKRRITSNGGIRKGNASTAQQMSSGADQNQTGRPGAARPVL